MSLLRLFPVSLLALLIAALFACDQAISRDAALSLNPAPGAPVHLRLYKRESVLELWTLSEEGIFQLAKTYPICTWSGTLGPKLKQGDKQSPEGFYQVTTNSLNPNSRYHLSFNLGYPNAYDRAHGRTGDYLMVHGDCVSIGCYAMTDAGIDEIYGAVEAALTAGQGRVKVHIFPFRMTPENLGAAATSPWSGFWQNLAEEDQLFARTKIPGKITVVEKRYLIE
ncbi:MAG: murein L,D-transpeptidase family protein [Parvularculaceae bacterium]